MREYIDYEFSALRVRRTHNQSAIDEHPKDVIKGTVPKQLDPWLLNPPQGVKITGLSYRL
jgi:hypothetical protein